MNTGTKVSDIGAYKKPIMSVGTEFMEWAETYWGIENKYDQVIDPSSRGGEVCHYQAVKSAFIKQIDDTISQRIKHYL